MGDRQEGDEDHLWPGWQKLWKGYFFSANSSLVVIYVLLRRLSESFQQKAPCFRRNFIEKIHAFGKSQQKALCWGSVPKNRLGFCHKNCVAKMYKYSIFVAKMFKYGILPRIFKNMHSPKCFFVLLERLPTSANLPLATRMWTRSSCQNQRLLRRTMTASSQERLTVTMMQR